jgi:alpha-ketoglutarate-dependent taurine dioxygenase
LTPQQETNILFLATSISSDETILLFLARWGGDRNGKKGQRGFLSNAPCRQFESRCFVILQTRPLSYALGVEVMGVDLRQPLSDSALNEVKDLWDQHLVLLFRDQELTPEAHIAFTRNFGEPGTFSIGTILDGYPEIFRVTNKLVNGKPSTSVNTGRNWHADQTWSDAPALGSFLRCKEKPDIGGDTMFANMCLAYERLSSKMKDFLEDMEAIHDWALVAGIDARDPNYVAEMKRRNPPVIHKAVVRHPRTGRKALYIGDRVRRFVGMTEDESQPFLQYLVSHATHHVMTYRHQWRVNDLIMYDNRHTMHHALADFDLRQARDMLRTTILGDKIGQRIESESKPAA